MFGLGWPEVILIVIVILLIFGSKKLPEMGGAIGKTLRGFKKEMSNPEENSTTDRE